MFLDFLGLHAQGLVSDCSDLTQVAHKEGKEGELEKPTSRSHRKACYYAALASGLLDSNMSPMLNVLTLCYPLGSMFVRELELRDFFK